MDKKPVSRLRQRGFTMFGKFLSFKPFFILLTLSGYYVSFPRSVRGCSRSAVLKTTLSLLCCLSSGFVTAVYMESAILTTLHPSSLSHSPWSNSDGSLPLYVSNLCTFYLCFVSVFFTYSVTRRLPRFLSALKVYYQENGRESAERKVKFCISVSSFLSFVFVVIATWLFVISFGEEVHCQLDNNTIITQNVSGLPWYDQALFYYTMYQSIVRTLIPDVVYYILWAILFLEASSLNEHLSKHDFVTSAHPEEDLEQFRLRHNALCRLIDKANAVLRHFLFAKYGFGMPVTLFILRILIWNELELRFSQSMQQTMAITCIQMVIVTVTSAALSVQMHKPAGPLYQIRSCKMSGKGFQELSLFLSRLQSGSIGFNVYRLLTIDTSAILVIGGTFVTYAIIIVQFQPVNGSIGRYIRHSAASNSSEIW